MKNLIQPIKNDWVKAKADKRNLSFVITVIIGILLMLTNMGDTQGFTDVSKTQITFNVNPPLTYDWSILPEVELLHHSAAQNEVIQYAWEISHDKDFLYTLKAENGLLTHDRRHDISHWCNRTSRWEDDFGFGVSACYHPNLVGNPLFFTDWRWQLREVYKLYKGGTRFYGYDVRWKVKHHFKFN